MPRLPDLNDTLVLGPIIGTGGTGIGAIHGVQAMRISFADSSVLDEVLKHGTDLKISFGKSMKLDYGDQSMEIVPTGESNRHELYKRSPQDSLDFVGVFSHSLQVREADDKSPDESLLNLQKSYDLLTQEKAAATTTIVGYGGLPPPKNARRNGPLRKAPYLKKNKKQLSTPSSGPSTPTLKSSRSPVNPSSGSSSVSPEMQAKLDAMRFALIHILAVGPASEHSLASRIRAPEEMCLKVLPRVAEKVKGGRQWALMDDVFKELDAWDFPYNSSEQRSQAIENGREAFGRLKLEKRAPEWKMLRSPEDREKAEFSPPPPDSLKPTSARHTSKPASESGRSPISPPQAKKTLPESIKVQPKAVKSTKADQISRIIGAKSKKKTEPKKVAITKPKGPLGRPPNASKPVSQKQSSTGNPKIKSAEIIVDSDEDVELEEARVPHPKPQQASKKLVSPRPPPLKKPTSKMSTSTSPDREGEGIRLKSVTKAIPKSTMPKPAAKRPRTSPPVTSTSSSQSNGSAKTVTANKRPSIPRDVVSQRGSSNSPPKPSPLGSSPPINASDVDTASTSSSPTFTTSVTGTSTASQSPLDSLSGRNNKPRYIPAPAVSLKRKANVSSERDDAPHGTIRVSGSGITAAQNKRRHAEIPDPYTMKLARRFKEEYSRYERLYKEAQTMTDMSRKKDTIDQVLVMHRNLEKLKNKIAYISPV